MLITFLWYQGQSSVKVEKQVFTFVKKRNGHVGDISV